MEPLRKSNGESIDGDFDGISEGSPADDFQWTFGFAPLNDDFSGATLLSGNIGSIRGTTLNTSFELQEPLGNDNDPIGGMSLWYQWQASDDGWTTFDTSRGSELNTIVSVYTGSSLDALVPIAFNDDFGTLTGSRVSIPTKAGTLYTITVAGRTLYGSLLDYIGAFTLSWYPTPPPSFRASSFSPTTALPGAKVTLFGTNFTGASEVLFNGARAEFSPGLTNNSDLRITATVPPDASDGPITIRTPHGDVTSSVNFVLLPPPLQAALTASRRIEVSWPATSFMFVLEAADNLRDPIWNPVAPLVLANRSTIFRPEPATGNRFYRLTKRLPVNEIDPRGVVPLWGWLLARLRSDGFVVLSVSFRDAAPFPSPPEKIAEVRGTIRNRLITQGFIINDTSPCADGRCPRPTADIHWFLEFSNVPAFYMSITNENVLWALAQMPEVAAIGGTVDLQED